MPLLSQIFVMDWTEEIDRGGTNSYLFPWEKLYEGIDKSKYLK